VTLVTFTVSILIERPVSLVDEALNRMENHPHFQRGLRTVELVSGEVGKVGAVMRQTVDGGGREHILMDTLLEVEPGSRYVSRVEGPGITVDVETLLRDEREGTMMSITATVRLHNLLMRLLLPLRRGMVRRDAIEELWKFKHLVETRGANFDEV